MRLVLEGNVHLLQLALALDEAVVMPVDQDVVDVRIVEQRLQRPETDELVDDLVDQRLQFGDVDRQAFGAYLLRHELLDLGAHLLLRQTLEHDEVDLLDQHAVDAHARVELAARGLGRRRRLRLGRCGNADVGDGDGLFGVPRRVGCGRRRSGATLEGCEAAHLSRPSSRACGRARRCRPLPGACRRPPPAG